MSAEKTSAAAQPAAAAAVTTEAPVAPSLLDKVIEASTRLKNAEPDVRQYHSDLVGQLVEDIMSREMTVSQDTEQMLNERIAELDELLSDQLNAIMHDPEFQKLEASWRGLKYLVFGSETDEMLQIRVLNTSKKELLRDMETAKEFDQSGLFKKIYTSEYDTPGGTPYGALIGDFEFGKHPQDIELLKRISNVAAQAHAPFVAAASPQLFGWETFTEMPEVRDLAEIFRTREYDKWKMFRESEDSRYVGLCLPHILMRDPYGAKTRPVEEFQYEEGVDGRDHSKYLWGNAAYAMAARMTDAFSKYGWCAWIRGAENGGLVRDLPLHSFSTDDGEIANKCPTEVLIGDRRENELARLGFISLAHYKSTDYAVFFSARSCQKPFQYDSDAATANADLSAEIPYILMTSRFAHYLKVIARDKIGSFMSRKECEEWLNQWVSNYVTPDLTASDEAKRKYPLNEAAIKVEDDPRRPGCYRAIAWLRPHYMLNELTVSMRLVSELPSAARKQ
jgi:type VI secretion system protein ImpC